MSEEDSQGLVPLLRKKVRNLFSDIQRGFASLYKEEEDYITLILSISDAEQVAEKKLKAYLNTHKTNVRIREAKKEDISTITDIYRRAWKASHLPMKDITKEILLEILEDSNTHFFVAIDDSKEVGFILIEFSKLNKEIGLISGLAILPEYQGKGIGISLSYEAWNFFKDKGVQELRCEVYKENEKAKQFIKNLGFQERVATSNIYSLK